MIHALSSKTLFPNTAETDLMPKVYHAVDWSSDSTADFGTAYVKAKDPVDAMRKIHGLTVEEVSQYAVKPASN